MDRLYEHMYRLVDSTTSEFHRYIYPQIAWDNRMLALVGPRGVGKTTLFLQRIRDEHDLSDTLYITADHMYFADHTLFDTAEAFNKAGGLFLFVDEVHKYPGWSRELKAIYDSFPDMHVYFTGSSILDIVQGEADLSRRAPRYLLQGLSFREYLSIVHGIGVSRFDVEDILANKASIPGVAHPLPLYRDYLRRGYYPFGQDADFFPELDQVISRTLEVDIPQFQGMSSATGVKLKRLMAVVSTLAPFAPNMTKLGSQIQVSRNNIEEYLNLMDKAGMIAQLRTGAQGLGSLGKVQKVYLDNTNILYCLSGGGEDIGSVRETFFFNQMRVNNVVTASRGSDFEIAGRTFEVGGKNKGKRQIAGLENAYVVKDDIEYGHGNVVPLWAFGLNY